MTFLQYLEKRDIQLYEQIIQERFDEFNALLLTDGVLLDKAKQYAKKYGLPLAAAAAIIAGGVGAKSLNNAHLEKEKTAKQQSITDKPLSNIDKTNVNKITDNQLQSFVQFMQDEYPNLNLKKEEFKTFTPRQVLMKYYGSGFDAILKKAQDAQKIGKIDSIIPDISTIDKDQIALFRKPSELNTNSSNSNLPGGAGEANGICKHYKLGNRDIALCVMSEKDFKGRVGAHEATHGMQQTDIDNISFGNYNVKDEKPAFDGVNNQNVVDYILHPKEFGVRIAGLKRAYFMKTGVDDRPDLAWKDLENRQKEYPEDVQNLMDVFNLIRNTKGKDEAKKITDYIYKNWDKFVNATNGNKNTHNV